MSEYQFVAFRAIDQPVSEANLEYMEQQSSRAEITPWLFENEYNFGDFRGNAVEMLRRGYGIHLHFADFGVRKLMIRLPFGLPNPKAATPYLVKNEVELINDKSGPGCILVIQPVFEPGALENLFDISDLVDDLVPLRNELIDGDLRPLYLAHLAVMSISDHDREETHEAPVPAGLDDLTPAQKALCTLYGLGDGLIEAAAEAAPATDKQDEHRARLADWLRSCAAAKKEAWLLEWLSDSQSGIRGEILAQFQKDRPPPLWPTAVSKRTIAALWESAEAISRVAQARAAASAARAREARLAEMRVDPQPFLKKVDELVERRGSSAYREAATLLEVLREALQGTSKAKLADTHAEKLRKLNPTLKMLIGALREKGFLPKNSS